MRAIQGDPNLPASFCNVEMSQTRNFVSAETPYLEPIGFSKTVFNRFKSITMFFWWIKVVFGNFKNKMEVAFYIV